MKHLLLILSSLFLALHTYACCTEISVPRSYKYADVVAVGTVVKNIDYTVITDSINGYKFSQNRTKSVIVISKAYKGLLYSDTISISSMGSSIDYPFEEGVTYIILARYTPNTPDGSGVNYQSLSTNICLATQRKNFATMRQIKKLSTKDAKKP